MSDIRQSLENILQDKQKEVEELNVMLEFLRLQSSQMQDEKDKEFINLGLEFIKAFALKKGLDYGFDYKCTLSCDCNVIKSYDFSHYDFNTKCFLELEQEHKNLRLRLKIYINRIVFMQIEAFFDEEKITALKEEDIDINEALEIIKSELEKVSKK